LVLKSASFPKVNPSEFKDVTPVADVVNAEVVFVDKYPVTAVAAFNIFFLKFKLLSKIKVSERKKKKKSAMF